MTRVLVSGGTGFVGSNVVRRLLRDAMQVDLLVRPERAMWRLDDVAADIRTHVADLADAEGVERVVVDVRPDWIFHLAAHGAYSSQTDARRMVLTNVVGTTNLLEAALRVGFAAFVNAGSSSEYGFKDHAPAEDDVLEPNSAYAATKASAALYCAYAARRTGANVTTLRLYSVYGPYEEPTRLIPALAVAGLRRQLPPLVNPDIARDFVFVDDVVDAFLLAARSVDHSPIFNVGTGTQLRLRDVVATVREQLLIPEEPRWGSMPNRTWDTDVWVADASRIRGELGWEPRYNFSAGFAAFVTWLRNNPDVLRVYEGARTA